MSKLSQTIAQLISLVGLGTAVYLTRLHFIGSGSESELCNTFSATGCNAALNSRFSTVGGVPLSLILVGIYATLFVAARIYGKITSKRPWATVAAFLCVTAVFGGIFLLGVMAESKSYCPLCIFLDGCNLVLGALWVREFLTQKGPLITVRPIAVAIGTLGIAWALGLAIQMHFFPHLESENDSSATRVTVPTESQIVTQCQDVELSALEISDFLCPYCKKLEHNLSAVLSDCGAKVDKRFVHFPLDKSCNRFVTRDLHPGACRLAEASECARLQGKFPSFASSLFAKTPKTNKELWQLATEHELNLTQFKTCLKEGQTADRVRTDIELAHRLGVRSTPTFYINGRRLEGAFSTSRLRTEVAKALNQDIQEAQTIAGGPDAKDSWSNSEPAEACGSKEFSQEQQGCKATSPIDYFAP